MEAVGIWLSIVGLCDLARSDGDLTARRRRILVIGVGATLLLLVALASDPVGRGWWGWGLCTLGLVAWVEGSAGALAHSRRQWPGNAVQHGRWRFVVAYAGLTGGLLAAITCGPWMGVPNLLGSVLEGSTLASLPPQRVVLTLGVVLVQLATANVAVRLLLDLVGVPAHDNEKQLRGGRILGPMERVLVVGLGAAGSLTGASLVIAAKALLRFPELRAPDPGRRPHGGPSDITEYFLVGSLASWMVALAGVGLLALQ